jgi:hypothetical protein
VNLRACRMHDADGESRAVRADHRKSTERSGSKATACEMEAEVAKQDFEVVGVTIAVVVAVSVRVQTLVDASADKAKSEECPDREDVDKLGKDLGVRQEKDQGTHVLFCGVNDRRMLRTRGKGRRRSSPAPPSPSTAPSWAQCPIVGRYTTSFNGASIEHLMYFIALLLWRS